MLTILRWLALASFWSYLVALVALSLFGLLAPVTELATLYDLDLGLESSVERNTLLHQYRFLKAFVLGFAVYTYCFRRRIFEEPLHNRIFLFTLFAAAIGRVLSLTLDGAPHATLVPLTAAEFIFGFAIFAYTRYTLRR